MFVQLMPLLSAILAIVIFREKLELYHFIGASFILSGIYLSNRKVYAKVAVLDDYQNVFHQLINTKEYEKI